MSKNDYEVVKLNKHTFFFKYEENLNILHIWVRHLKKASTGN